MPGILIYRNGELADKIIPARDVFGGKRATVETVEFVLALKNLIKVEFDEDPREKLKVFKAEVARKGPKKRKNEDESDSEEEEDREYISNQLFKYKH